MWNITKFKKPSQPSNTSVVGKFSKKTNPTMIFKQQVRFFTDEIAEPNKFHPIPQLPVLDKMTQLALEHKILPDLSRTKVIGVQHMLETTSTLFQKFIELGVQPHNMYFAGKCYSTAPSVANTIRGMGIHVFPGQKPEEIGHYQEATKATMKKLWEKCIDDIKQNPSGTDTLIVLDEGGRCFEEMPNNLKLPNSLMRNLKRAVIEQTRAGLYSPTAGRLPLPFIEVASAAVKKRIESPLIATAVLRKVKQIVPQLKLNESAVCGVVGNGAIGYAIANYLISLGHSVAVYDENEHSFQQLNPSMTYRMPDIKTLIANSDCVFGCTGKDITLNLTDLFDSLEKDITLVSCSSEDKEFRSLLRKISHENRLMIDPLSTFVYLSNNRKKITIVEGGYPVNFDREPWNVPARDIEVTQMALLGSFMQAVLEARPAIPDGRTIHTPTLHCLDPYIQRFGFMHWIPPQPKDRYKKEEIAPFTDIEWVIKNSGGSYYANEKLKRCFEKVNHEQENIKNITSETNLQTVLSTEPKNTL